MVCCAFGVNPHKCAEEDAAHERRGGGGRMTFRQYLDLEMQEMRRHKWIESEKAGHDLGADALIDWIENHSAAFRLHLRRRYGSQPGLPF